MGPMVVGLAWFAISISTISARILDHGFKTLKHGNHPHHKILLAHNGVAGFQQHSLLSDAVKPQSLEPFCAGATPGYVGYLVSGSKHFYFTFFESRSEPGTDPLILWLNGGPGCSSMIGLFQEHGPCRIETFSATQTVKNEDAWINAASMFYLDQPIGVGFSFDANPSAATINSTFAAAEDVVAFLKIWYEHFPSTKKLDLHMAGESYGGHYIPIFADHILINNEAALIDQRPGDVIPLKSILIGNGAYDHAYQEASHYDMTCTQANGVGPLVDGETCERMKHGAPECKELYDKCSAEREPACDAVWQHCAPILYSPYLQTNRSVYDVRRHCPGRGNGPCYEVDEAIKNYLDRADVREAFHVDARASDWQMCNDHIFDAFINSDDIYYPVKPFLEQVLTLQLPVFLFAGTSDFLCNYVGNERFLQTLDWRGGAGFRTASKSPQKWSGGLWWESANLRWARVANSGHFVPYDQPVVALRMVQAWLKKEPLV